MTPEERKARALRALEREKDAQQTITTETPEPETFRLEAAPPAPGSEAPPLELRGKVARRGRKGGLVKGASGEGFLELALTNGLNVTGTLRLNFVNRPDLYRLGELMELPLTIRLNPGQ